jgi:hypothetical protein
MKRILALLALSTVAAMAQPAITAVLDGAAYTNNIAQGSVFVVKGSHAPDPVPGKACPRVGSGCAKWLVMRLTLVFKVCTKVCPYGSVRGAGSNPCPYRD